MTRIFRPIIAIDGPAGAGKSTVAALVAKRLGLLYLDTGAMYRAIALLALRAGMRPPLDDEDEKRLRELCSEDHLTVEASNGSTRVLLNGEDVSGKIRTPECSEMSSAVSAVSAVRQALVPLQQRIGRASGAVMEGRDIGSVVFPDATVKIYLTASEDERARRRLKDVERSGLKVRLEDVRRQQSDRDLRDSTRQNSPLMVAPGAVVVDTTGMTLEEVVETVVSELENSLDSAGQNTVRSRNY